MELTSLVISALSLVVSIVGLIVSAWAWIWAKRASQAADKTSEQVRKGVSMCALGLNEILESTKSSTSLRFDDQGNAIGKNVKVQPAVITSEVQLPGGITKHTSASNDK